jgi:flavodoxin
VKSPQQSIYDTVFATSLNLGYSTYPYLSAKDVAYPFVFVGEQFDQDMPTKSVIYGLVNQTVHIYHTYKKRRELTDMMNTLKREFRKLKKAGNYYLAVRNINAQTMIDNSTGEPLLHGIIEIEFRFN